MAKESNFEGQRMPVKKFGGQGTGSDRKVKIKNILFDTKIVLEWTNNTKAESSKMMSATNEIVIHYFQRTLKNMQRVTPPEMP